MSERNLQPHYPLTKPTEAQVGWSIEEWCNATTICRASFYLLKTRPHLVKLGRRTIITEAPADYLARISIDI